MADDNRDVLIDVQNVSKRFCKDLKRSIRYGFMDSIRAIAGKSKTVTNLRKEEFWAVKDVTFQLRRGECLGLIGHNGAGKSTLLKMLNGLIRPDQGTITIRGKIGALIELGAGFNPILTGRENIYNNGAVLGFTHKEIDTKVEDIIDFAEIREFIDMPVQSYSSGMRVRLGFAVAAQMEPDVLLIDEVLAVGDTGFKIKCFEKIDELISKCCVILVSHSMTHIGKICSSVGLLHKGEINYYGNDIPKGINLYYNEFSNNITKYHGDQNVILEDLQIQKQVNKYTPLNIDLKIRSNIEIEKFFITIRIFNKENILLGIINSHFVDLNKNDIKIFKCLYDKNYLSNGVYHIGVVFRKATKIDKELVLGYYQNFADFEIKGEQEKDYAGFDLPSTWEVY